MNKFLNKRIIMAMAFAGFVSAAQAVDEGFEGASTGDNSGSTPYLIPNTSVYALGTSGTPNVRDFGANSGQSVFTRGGAVFGTNSLSATPAVGTFSVTGGTEIYDSSNVVRWDRTGGGLGFGYNNSGGSIGPYNGGSSNISIALVKTNDGYFTGTGPNDPGADPVPPPQSSPTFRLSYANNTSQNLGAFTQFGDAEVAFQSDHWYQLGGVLTFNGYNSGTGESSFDVIASVYDLGEEGAENPTGTLVLSGSTSFTVSGDWSTSQPIFWAKDDRGFNQIDNLTYIPEPGTLTLALVAFTGFMVMRIRCRC